MHVAVAVGDELLSRVLLSWSINVTVLSFVEDKVNIWETDLVFVSISDSVAEYCLLSDKDRLPVGVAAVMVSDVALVSVRFPLLECDCDGLSSKVKEIVYVFVSTVTPESE